jgi:Cu+-exporting ATPase
MKSSLIAVALVATVVLLAVGGPWLAREIASAPRLGGLAVHAGQRTVTLAVGGMTCQGCARTIQARIAAVPGVAAVEVRLGARRAYVVCDRAVSDAELVAAVERPGQAFTAAVAIR